MRCERAVFFGPAHRVAHVNRDRGGHESEALDGYILDRGQISMDIFGRFAEMCKVGAGGSTLAFVGTGHKVSLRAYAGKGLSEADINVVSDRVQAVALRSEGLEDIIAAVVLPQRDHPLWQAEIEPRKGTLNTAVLGCSKAGIFTHLKGPVLRERIIENIYPMHPMATHCAIQLSKEVGSAARSLRPTSSKPRRA